MILALRRTHCPSRSRKALDPSPSLRRVMRALFDPSSRRPSRGSVVAHSPPSGLQGRRGHWRSWRGGAGLCPHLRSEAEAAKDSKIDSAPPVEDQGSGRRRQEPEEGPAARPSNVQHVPPCACSFGAGAGVGSCDSSSRRPSRGSVAAHGHPSGLEGRRGHWRSWRGRLRAGPPDPPLLRVDGGHYSAPALAGRSVSPLPTPIARVCTLDLLLPGPL